MGRLGIIQAILLLFVSYHLVAGAIDLQEENNKLVRDENTFSGKEINDFMDFVQGKVIIWQAAWAFVFIVGIYFLYVSFRLMTGTDILRGVVSSKVPIFDFGDRQFFIYTVIAVSLILFSVGFVEAHGINEVYRKIYGLEDLKEGTEEQRYATANGSVIGYCNTAFLFLILLMAFFTRDKPGSDEFDSEENIITSEDDNSNVNNDDTLDSIDMTKEQVDED